jgi:hypothetical protein
MMDDLISISKIIKADNNPYNYLVFQTVNDNFKSVLLDFGFKQIFKRDNHNLRISHFYNDNYNYKFIAYENDYQVLMHKALAIIEKFSQLLSNKYQIHVVSGFLNKKLVLVCEANIIIEIKVTKRKNTFELRGTYSFNLNNFFDVVKRISNFALAPIQIVIIPLQLNDKKVRVKANDLSLSLISKYRTIIDNSDSQHPLKQKLAKKLKIPVMIIVGSNSKLGTLDVILTNSMDYYNVKTNEFETFLEEKFKNESILNFKVAYSCDAKKCQAKFAITYKSEILIKPFNQAFDPSSTCQVCQKPAKSKYIIVKGFINAAKV